jgi:hypothetical protein
MTCEALVSNWDLVVTSLSSFPSNRSTPPSILSSVSIAAAAAEMLDSSFGLVVVSALLRGVAMEMDAKGAKLDFSRYTVVIRLRVPLSSSPIIYWNILSSYSHLFFEGHTTGPPLRNNKA